VFTALSSFACLHCRTICARRRSKEWCLDVKGARASQQPARPFCEHRISSAHLTVRSGLSLLPTWCSGIWGNHGCTEQNSVGIIAHVARLVPPDLVYSIECRISSCENSRAYCWFRITENCGGRQSSIPNCHHAHSGMDARAAGCGHSTRRAGSAIEWLTAMAVAGCHQPGKPMSSTPLLKQSPNQTNVFCNKQFDIGR